ncbi:MAG: hypothetical protein M1549_03980 [Candidatus Dependentiae bacterium]|nr:hypothetical protein [Candidatus Dependentiae bacterium]
MNDIKKLLLAALVAAGASVIYADDSDGCGCCGVNTGASTAPDGSPLCHCDGGEYTNKTFWADWIQFYQSGTYLHEALTPNAKMWSRSQNGKDEPGWGGFVVATPFGGQTTDKGRKDLGRWFGLNHSNTMIAVEEDPRTPESNDSYNVMTTSGAALDVRHFNVQTVDGTFQSTISFCPKQTHFGVGFSWRQTFWKNEDESARWWGELSGPVVHLKNTMGFKETVTNDGGGVANDNGTPLTGLDDSPRVANMTQAFAQSNWKYGKIYACNSCSSCYSGDTLQTSPTCGCECKCKCGPEMEDTSFAFLEGKIGYNEVVTDCCMIGTYGGVVFPTGKGSCPSRVFSPFNGGKHWGLMWGSELGFNMFTNDESAIRLRFAVDGRFYFKHCEKRSFDLVGKPWSRYMEMYENQEAAQAAVTNDDARGGTSGINIMTMSVQVTPRAQLNLNTGVVYDGKCFKAEIGHTWYGRESERIRPNWNYSDTTMPVLKGFNGLGNVNKARTIRDRFTGGYVSCNSSPIPSGPQLVYNSSATPYSTATGLPTAYDAYKIQKCDVDWHSAEQEAVLAHTVYGTIGYDWSEACYPTLVTIGGAYDWTDTNCVSHRWTVFGKIGVSF